MVAGLPPCATGIWSMTRHIDKTRHKDNGSVSGIAGSLAVATIVNFSRSRVTAYLMQMHSR